MPIPRRCLFLCCAIAVSAVSSTAWCGEPVYDTADQRPFWHASVLDWQFIGDGYTANTLGESVMPTRMVELILWRVTSTKTPKGAMWNAQAWLYWRSSGRDQDQPGDATTAWTSTITLRNGSTLTQMVRSAKIQPLYGTKGDLFLSLPAGEPPADYRIRLNDDFGVVMSNLGLPDLVVPSRATPGRTIVFDQAGGPGWTSSEPEAKRSIENVNLGQMNMGGMKLHLKLDVSATGPIQARTHWDQVAGRPAWSTTDAKLAIILSPAVAKPLPKDHAAPTVGGTLIIKRHSWRLTGSEGWELPRDVGSILKSLGKNAVIAGKMTPWPELAAGKDSAWAQVGNGVIDAAAQPPVAESTPAKDASP